MKSLLSTALLLLFSSSVMAQETRSFQENGLYGFAKEGKTTIAPEYHYAFDFIDGLALVKKDKLWGFINETNEVIVPFTFDRCSEFLEGFAIVEKDGKFGIVDTQGKMAIPAECDYVEVLKDDYCIGQKNGKFALFSQGEQKSAFVFDEIDPLHHGFFRFKQNEKYGVLDKEGHVRIEALFVSRPYCYFSDNEFDGYYFVGNLKEDGERSFFSNDGDLVLNGDEYDIQQVQYPVLYAGTKNGKTKVVNVASGDLIVPNVEGKYVDITRRPCDGYGYSSTNHLYFETKDNGYLMVSTEAIGNAISTEKIPIIFEEFVMVPKSRFVFDIYNHRLDLLTSDVNGLYDPFWTFNAEERICSFQEVKLSLWKEGKMAQWNAVDETIEFVQSGKLDGSAIFKTTRDFGADATLNILGSDNRNFIFEIVDNNEKTLYVMKDDRILWELDDYKASDVIKFRKFDYDDILDGDETYEELMAVLLKVNGKKEEFGW